MNIAFTIPLPHLALLVAASVAIVWLLKQRKKLEDVCEECGEPLSVFKSNQAECVNPECPMYHERVS